MNSVQRIKTIEVTSTQATPKNKAAVPSAQKSPKKIAVGLSACLAGHPVRYNGGHSQSRLCLNQLAEHFDFTTFCPEVAAGFGTPRPAMRLHGNPDQPSLIYSDGHDGHKEALGGGVPDLRQQLTKGFTAKLDQFSDLDGYILMKNSPSCGLERVKVYQDNGHPHPRRVQGLFAKALQQAYPLMPVEEEGRLHDPQLGANFILRVYAHHHFRTQVLACPSIHALTGFHQSYKYLLMAQDQNACRRLGRLLGENHLPLSQLTDRYFAGFMAALATPASAKNHANALLHLLGYLKRELASPARRHIMGVIHQYRQGKLPLIAPLTLLQHYVEQHGSQYLRDQRYWQPYPGDLGLANRLFAQGA